MKFSQFHQTIQKLLDVQLPKGETVLNEGHSIAFDIQIGRTSFMDEMGVDSELEYKKQCTKDGKSNFIIGSVPGSALPPAKRTVGQIDEIYHEIH
jgi:hypothetical protein